MMIARVLILLSVLLSVAPLHAAVVFEDDFEYVADRAGTTEQIEFEAAGWSDAKAENTDYGSSGGYLYTLDNVTLGSKVLVMESIPTSVGGQTSYHLLYGGVGLPRGTIPANVWIQFWTYAVPGSLWDRQKFLYPCHTLASYPCDPNSFLWLLGIHDRDFTGVSDNETVAPAGGRYYRMTSAYANNSAATTGNEQKLYHNLNHGYMAEGVWYLMKIHVDVSGAQGTYEMWMRPRGTATWTKEAEWIGGVTANFDWPIPVGERDGAREMAMPTTVDTYDSTTYMDDFVMATSEGDLPTYNDAFASSTISGTTRFTGNVRIQ